MLPGRLTAARPFFPTRRSAVIVFAFAVVAVISMTRAIADDSEREFRIVGYLPEYRLTGFEVSSGQGLTDLMLFSAELNDDGSLNTSRLDQCPWPMLQELKHRHGVRLNLVIGGWERSKHFASVTASDERMKRSVDSVVRFLIQHQLDGVDLDWEHPQNEHEHTRYGELLSELHAAFTKHGLRLSVTIAPWQQLSDLAIESVDTVQVMAYDNDGPHSTMEQATGSIQKLSLRIPNKKLVLGLPFYGRDVQSREATTYGEIVAKFDPDPKSNQEDQIYFNGEATIREKVQYAMQAGLAGVMIWEIGQDAPGDRSLLKVIQQTVAADIERNDVR
jgi:chitinase